MLFNSDIFLFGFLPATFLIFQVVLRRAPGLAVPWLVVASLTFYTWWDASFLPVLLCSIAFNFLVGRAIWLSREAGRPTRARLALLLGLAGNLSALGFFKYANFAGGLLWPLFGLAWQPRAIGLPLGISFFTLTQIAYLCDVHAGKARSARPLSYGLFVTWFPHLIAGPVLHHSEVMPQFARQLSARRVRIAGIAAALTIFAIGLFKKAILADSLAPYANAGFDLAARGPVSMAVAATSTLAYSLQIYCDFSGYSDMAVGASMLFGVRLPHNFDSPYKAASIVEFWRRWHMTLSRFLRDYLYLPLGGNRRGRVRRYANLMTVMLIGGLWHGAGWTFVVWGGLHGAYLVVNHLWSARVAPLLPAGAAAWRPVAGRLLTFGAVCVAWIFFRADSLAAAASMVSGLLGLHGLLTPGDFTLPLALKSHLASVAGAIEGLGLTFSAGGGDMSLRAWLWIMPVLLGVLCLPNAQQILARMRPTLYPSRLAPLRHFAWRPSLGWGVAAGALVAVSVLFGAANQEFLYFQF